MAYETRGEPRVDRLTAFLWTAFSLGGFVAALFVPVHVLINNLAVPLRLLPAETLDAGAVLGLLASPLVKLYVIVFVAGALWHGFYRLKYLLYDMGLKRYAVPLTLALHGIAAAGTVAVVYYALILG